MSNVSHLTSDICIIGAGPAGIVASMFLAKQGIKALVIDKSKFPRDKVCGDALSGKAVDVLKKLDERIIRQFRFEPMQVGSWGVTFVAPNLKRIRIPFRDNKNEKTPPGFISKRIDFDDFLVRIAKQNYAIDVVEGLELTDFESQTGTWHCKTTDGKISVNARLLIVADGAQSYFAKHIAGIHVEHKNYCAGIRAYYSGVENLDSENFIELFFLDELLPGYFWIFPLPGGKDNVGLGVRSDKVSSKKMNLKEMLPLIIKTYPELKGRFKNATIEGNVKGFGLPLGSVKRKISGNGYMLCGDAASLIDPFTGEGIGNAMMSGMMAAQMAAKCVSENNFSTDFILEYDNRVYGRLWKELSLSRRMQQLVTVPWLFNLVVSKAAASQSLQELISCMFSDLDIRKKLKQPSFYLNLITN
jgi:geranylgeranyl reductase family protein